MLPHFRNYFCVVGYEHKSGNSTICPEHILDFRFNIQCAIINCTMVCNGI